MPEPEKPRPRRVEYTPPASQQIEHYSRQVCRDLGEEFAENEVVDGFTQFVKAVVRIMLRQKNEEAKVDTDAQK